jgi:hypothetical protein
MRAQRGRVVVEYLDRNCIHQLSQKGTYILYYLQRGIPSKSVSLTLHLVQLPSQFRFGVMQAAGDGHHNVSTMTDRRDGRCTYLLKRASTMLTHHMIIGP